MNYLLIRHAQTDADRITRSVFGKEGAPINEAGKQRAKNLRKALLRRGIDIASEPVAIFRISAHQTDS